MADMAQPALDSPLFAGMCNQLALTLRPHQSHALPLGYPFYTPHGCVHKPHSHSGKGSGNPSATLPTFQESSGGGGNGTPAFLLCHQATTKGRPLPMTTMLVMAKPHFSLRWRTAPHMLRHAFTACASIPRVQHQHGLHVPWPYGVTVQDRRFSHTDQIYSLDSLILQRCLPALCTSQRSDMGQARGPAAHSARAGTCIPCECMLAPPGIVMIMVRMALLAKFYVEDS